MAELPEPWEVEYKRRSVAMLSPGQWALKREEALTLLAELEEAVNELRKRRAREDS